MTAQRFEERPAVVEAMQYTRMALEADEVAKWCGGTQTDDGLDVPNLIGGGVLHADYGDWIIKDSGIFWVVKPDVFEKRFRRIAGTARLEDS